MTLAELKIRLTDILKTELGPELGQGEVSAFEVSYPTEARFGDFSCNVALVWSKALGQPPRQLAERLARPIEMALSEVEKVEVAGPGFLNLYMTATYWQQQLVLIDADYGRLLLGQGQKVQVEFISANPTGPTTIGNARGGFIGDVLSRVLERVGYEVTREYYFNNAGTQMAKLLESVKMEAGVLPETEERQYRGDYIRELAVDFKARLQDGDEERLKEQLAETVLKRYIEPAVEAMGISFDVWFNEKDLIRDGRFAETVRRLERQGLVFERDGAVWLKTAELGDERGERVLIKSNGDPTYMAPDIAYHVDIFGQRGFDWAIKVLGPDHIAQFPSVQAAVLALFPDKRLTMAGYQLLRVMRDGKEVKVSKRLGQFITVVDLIAEVGLPVARFLTLMRSADSHMDFDLDLAREQSAKNPYYYVMYAYARAHSIMAKAVERGLRPAEDVGKLDESGRNLVRAMSRLPELLAEIANDYGVHRLTFFGLELAKLWTEFYESARIIDLEPAQAAEKLYVVQRFTVFMDIYWSLLGIEPQQRMVKD